MSFLVWINGPFGAGKTTVAERLAVQWPAALVFDPEVVASMLWQLLPRELLAADYQDMPIWRRLVRTTVLEMLSEYSRPLIVPMTVVVPAYFDEIVGGLRRAGTDVAHFTLLAREETVRARLAGRDEDVEWAAAQLPRCVAALQGEMFAEYLATDERSVDDVVGEILERVPAGAR